MAKSVIPGKRIVAAKCKICGRVYWHFSDVEPWEAMERRLKSHIWFHVSRGDLTSEQAKHWQQYFDTVWVRVYDPSKIEITPEQFERLHPEFISLPDYEQLKTLAMHYPTGFVRIVRSWFEGKE